MAQTAFIFRTAPHGTASGREGLDAVLACSALTDEIAVFFIGDGVYQLLVGQQPLAVLGRDYTATFKLFELYDIEQVYVCDEDMAVRGLAAEHLLIPVQSLSRQQLQTKLAACDAKLMF
ncbi:sulfurtransferase complex subunit TusC [Pseudaeromonas sharmana]|uniref:Sulfurtransferase complex subunit TusC n=1 Tax=Pseudaeromonas sharmana TaxID=328412 RepID=A0ABV8CPH2_9GAMM